MNQVKSLILILAAFFLALVFLIILAVQFGSFSSNQLEKTIEEEIVLEPIAPIINYEEDNNVTPGLININEKDFSYLSLPDSLENFLNSNFNIQEIVYLLNTYFTFKDSSSLLAINPEDFFIKQEGSALDFAFFVMQVLKVDNLEAGVVRYDYDTDQSGFVAIFRDLDLPKYIVATNQGVFLVHHGWSFADLIKMEEERLQVKINRYAYFPPNGNDFTEPVFGYEWIYLNK